MTKAYFKNACSTILTSKHPMTSKIKERVSCQMKALSFKPKSVPSSGAMDQPASKALISLRRNNTSKRMSSLILLVVGCLDVNIVLHAFLQQAFVIQSLEHLHQWPNLFFISRLLDSLRSQNRLLQIFVVAFILCIFEKILYFNLRISCLLSCLIVLRFKSYFCILVFSFLDLGILLTMSLRLV